MSLTFSRMFALGQQAPDFQLPDVVSGKQYTFNDLKGDKATVVMFICNHCPYVKHINEAMVQLANDYLPQGVAFVAISANDAEAFPADGPEMMKQNAVDLGFPFPYLYDESQLVAKAYQAACTPDFYVFDGTGGCVYRGQFDDSRPKTDIPVTGNDIRAAIDGVLANQPVSTTQKPASGCNIKWKPGISPF